MSQELIDHTFTQTRSLFALPLEEKQKLLADENNRGWTPFNEETLDPANQKVWGSVRECGQGGGTGWGLRDED